MNIKAAFGKHAYPSGVHLCRRNEWNRFLNKQPDGSQASATGPSPVQILTGTPTINYSTHTLVTVAKTWPMKTYWGTGGIAPRILNLGTWWRLGSASRPGRFITPRRLYGHSAGVEKQSHHLICEEHNPDRPSRGLATVLTVLPQRREIIPNLHQLAT